MEISLTDLGNSDAFALTVPLGLERRALGALQGQREAPDHRSQFASCNDHTVIARIDLAARIADLTELGVEQLGDFIGSLRHAVKVAHRPPGYDVRTIEAMPIILSAAIESVMLPMQDRTSWLYLDKPEAELLKPLPAGSPLETLARTGKQAPDPAFVELE